MTARIERRRVLLALAVALCVCFSVLSSAPASAAPVPVQGRCSPTQGTAPRGEACVYLFRDAAAGKFAAQGAVNPRARHVWRIIKLEILTCDTLFGCDVVVKRRPFPCTTSYMKVSSGSWAGNCGQVFARMGYEVDYDHSGYYTVFTFRYDTGRDCLHP